MTARAMRSHASLGRRVAVALALLALAGSLFVEIHNRRNVTHARRSLGGAFSKVALPDTAGDDVRKVMASAHALARCGDAAASAALLDGITRQAPASSLHALASLGFQAAGDASGAARHATWAARLAPTDPDAAAFAEDALDRAMLAGLGVPARWTGGIGLGLLVLLLLGRQRRRARQRRVARWLAGLRGRLAFVVDGVPSPTTPWIDGETRHLLVDVHLEGPYGMPAPPPGAVPPLVLTASSAEASRSVRLRPVRDHAGGAVRVAVRPETLARLVAHPGRWRWQAMIDGHRIALADLRVAARGLAPIA